MFSELELNNLNGRTLRQRAHSAHIQGEKELAKQLYKQLLGQACIPEDVGNLGALLTEEEDLKQAISLYEKYLQKWPNNYQLLINLSNTHAKAGNLNKSIKYLEFTISKYPRAFKPIRKLANILFKINRSDKGIQLLENFCKLNPKEGFAWLELGVNLCNLQLREKGLQAFEAGSKALPEHSGLIANRLTLLKEFNNIKKAEELYYSLSINQKNNIHIQGAWAGILMKTESIEQAIKILHKLSTIEPDKSNHWINLAACKKAIKYNLDCQKTLKEGLKYNPYDEDLKQALSQSLSESGNINKAIKLLDIENKDWAKVPDEHIFNTQFIGSASGEINSEKLRSIAKEWEQKKLKYGLKNIYKDILRSPIKDRRIKVGYLSADYCNHPVSKFLLPILKTHDHRNFEIIGLSCGAKKDKVTKLMQSFCHHWIDLYGLEEVTMARIISDLKIDVIIELGGFTGMSKISSLIYKPAPIQLSYLGYFAPTFLSCIDGWIGDKELFSSLNSIEKEEKLIYVKGGYMTFEPIVQTEINRQPGEKIRFGSFNNSRKLSHASINLFSKVLKEVKNSQLVIKSITFVEREEQTRVKNLFLEAGVSIDQLIMLDWIDGTQAHMESYKWIDIALDPFPYGGATTTAEALWMGVPVITLAGEGMIGRLSSSILTSANCKEWIANDITEYIKLAKSLANEGLRNCDMRNKLKQKVANSDLSNGRRVSSQFEKLFYESLEKSHKI